MGDVGNLVPLTNLYVMVSIFSRKRKYNDLSWMQVDIHNHLLPGIDDGSASVAQSMELLTTLTSLGISQFIATPHICDSLYPNDKASIQCAWENMLRDTDLPTNRLRYAAEYMATEELLKSICNPSLPLLCLPGGYMLIEMTRSKPSPFIQEIIQKLINRGITPIIAHPERYNYCQQNTSLLKTCKDMGCLLQVDLLSCYGYYGPLGRNTVQYLAGKGMVDLVGTNVHDSRHGKAIAHYLRKEDVSVFFADKLRNEEFLLDPNSEEALRSNMFIHNYGA